MTFVFRITACDLKFVNLHEFSFMVKLEETHKMNTGSIIVAEDNSTLASAPFYDGSGEFGIKNYEKITYHLDKIETKCRKFLTDDIEREILQQELRELRDMPPINLLENEAHRFVSRGYAKEALVVCLDDEVKILADPLDWTFFYGVDPEDPLERIGKVVCTNKERSNSPFILDNALLLKDMEKKNLSVEIPQINLLGKN